ncbi:TonB-dependent receptor [Gracilimonas sp.]|uniref:TonB-dependent receptor n=1 Tax=Gracilimonas sp. TaxID=1974203 RepID=UPI0032EEC1BC
MQPVLKYLLLVCFSLSIQFAQLHAQSTIKGVITDQVDGETLVGASVIIVGTSLGTASGLDGDYIIRNVPAGNIQVRISYIGYQFQVFDITMTEDTTITLDVNLVAAAYEGEEISITAQARGQIAAINQQRASDVIMNVVSEEKIQELPDANAAESIGRLSGVSVQRSGGEANKVMLRGLSDKYLTVTVDGVRLPTTDALARGIDLSTISQSSLAGIELFKSVTPDKDGDAIAGSINLVTRKAPEDRMFRFMSRGSYNEIMNSAQQYDFSLKYGERFFNNVLGVQVNGNLERKIRSNERSSVSYSTDTGNEDLYFISGLNLRFTDEIRTREGVGAIFDVNTPDEGNIKLSSSYSFTKRDYITHSRNYPGSERDVFYSYRNTEQEIDLFTNSITGENYFLGFETAWGASYSFSSSGTPFDYELTFKEPGGMANTPRIESNAGQLIDYAYNNFQAASIDEGFYYEQENNQGELSLYADLSRKYNINSKISGTLKGGVKFRSQDRENQNFRSYSPYYLGYWRAYELHEDGTIAEKNFEGSYFEDFYQSFQENSAFRQISFSSFLNPNPRSKVILGDFNMNPLVSRDRFRQWYNLNINGVNQNGTGFEYYDDPSARANTYDIKETVSAAYLMNTFNFGQRVTAIAGARIEQENHEYQNTYSPRQIGGFPIPEGTTRDTSSTYSETILLPHLHVNVKTTDFMNVRLAAYRALARPDYNMRLLSFFAWREASTGGDRIFVIGNPILKTAKAWNFEVSTAFHGNKVGLFTISAFYKQIDDMYHMLNGISTRGDVLIEELGLEYSSPHSAGYRLFVPYNSPDPSYVQGIEIDHQINFSWLPGLLKNMVLNYNVSFVDSKTTLRGQRTDTTYVQDPILGPLPRYNVVPIMYSQEMEDQPELFGNISLGYDIGGFSGRVSVFHQAEYYRSFSPRRTNDPISGAYTKVDIALNYKFSNYLTVMANLNNVTSIREDDFRHNRRAGYTIPTSSEQYGMTFDLGVRIDL